MSIYESMKDDIRIFKQQMKKTPFFSAERKVIRKRLRTAKFYQKWINNMLHAGYKRLDFSPLFHMALSELYHEYLEKVKE